MAMQKAKPAAKKIAATKTTISKPKTTKTTVAAPAKKVVAKKPAPAVTKPKNTKTPAVKKALAPAAATKSPAKKTATAKVAATVKKMAASLTPEERYRMVETAAYFIAERHGFQGDSTEHWSAAEKEISERLR